MFVGKMTSPTCCSGVNCTHGMCVRGHWGGGECSPHEVGSVRLSPQLQPEQLSFYVYYTGCPPKILFEEPYT